MSSSPEESMNARVEAAKRKLGSIVLSENELALCYALYCFATGSKTIWPLSLIWNTPVERKAAEWMESPSLRHMDRVEGVEKYISYSTSLLQDYTESRAVL